MDLRIRSQDRRRLIPNPNLYVVEDKENGITYIGDVYVGHIGSYKTEERALEVLDEIQSLLQPKIIYHQKKPVETIQEVCYQLRQKENMEFQELSTYVYEMPKE